MIDIIVTNVKCKINNLTDAHIIKEFDQKMSYMVEGANFANRYGWDGRQRLFTKNHYFPVGLLGLAKSILTKYKLEYNIIDKRTKPEYGESLILDSNSGFEVRDHQTKAVALAIKHGSGVIKMSTGSGKTMTLCSIVGHYNVKTVIYVISIDLLYQMESTLKRMYPDLKVGLVGDGNCDIQNITICTLWSAASAFDIKVPKAELDDNAFSKKDMLDIKKKSSIRAMVNQSELLIIDECQFAACAAAQLVHKESFNARHRFLFSATPWRDDKADLLIDSIAGDKIYDVSATELINKQLLVPPKIHFVEIPVMKNVGATYAEVYSNYVVENPKRNEIVLKATQQMVDKGKKVLVLVSRINHAKILAELFKDKFRLDILDGSDNSTERERVINAMKNNELDVIIATRIFDQGVDIPNLDGLILACSGKSSTRALQRIGRVIRKHHQKKEAIVVDFMDNCKYLREHTKSRIKIYKTEPAFKIIFPKGYYEDLKK